MYGYVNRKMAVWNGSISTLKGEEQLPTFYKFKYLGVNIWEIIQQLSISLSCDKISLAEDYFGCFCRYWYIAKHVKKSHREFYCFDFFVLLRIICPGTVYLLRPAPPASSTSPNFLLSIIIN